MPAINFTNPIHLSTAAAMWLILPLCLAVVAVYKTIRAERPGRILRDMLFPTAYVLVGLAALGLGLWALQEYWP
jgi:hypothetical protein